MSPILGARGGLAASAYGFTSAVAALGDYQSIATTTVGSGGQTTISFTSIPSTYKHLQRRGIGRDAYTGGTGLASLYWKFNSDSGSNYASHRLAGNGSTAYSGSEANATKGDSNMTIFPVAANGGTDYGVFIMDILDYADTNKYKTIRLLAGNDSNSSYNNVGLISGLWRSTSAITQIDFTTLINFVQYSQIALYGIKG
jgi:hypothetical protein